MASHAKHIEMKPDLMGSHSNGAGIAIFEVAFGKDGRVINAEAVSGHPLALVLLIKAAPKWRFSPVIQNGVPKQACGRLRLKFSIVNNQASVSIVEAK